MILGLAATGSCGYGSDEIGRALESQLERHNRERVDLSTLGGPEWDRVCIFGPYSDNSTAERALGFRWDLERKTSVHSSDRVNVLAFVKGTEVVAFVEHPRNLGDFAELSGTCLARKDAVLERDTRRGEGWVSPLLRR